MKKEEMRASRESKGKRRPDGMGRSGGSEGEGERGILLVKARDFPKMVAAQGSFLERSAHGPVNGTGSSGTCSTGRSAALRCSSRTGKLLLHL